MPRYSRPSEDIVVQRGSKLRPVIREEKAYVVSKVKVTTIKSQLFYTILPNDAKGDGRRWYYLGKVRVAFMNVYDPGTRMGGDFSVYTNHNKGEGNGGTWFMDEDEAHEFIIAELSA